jgi:hypothetical protein
MLVGIAGKAYSGKDTLADYLCEILDKKHGLNICKASFANDLKVVCTNLFDLDYEQLWGSNKELPDIRYPKKDVPEKFFTSREIMQMVGSFCRSIDPDYWVKKLYNNIKGLPNVIIPDVRHINEVNLVKKHGLLIKINREKAGSSVNSSHISETALDNFKDYDIFVDNNSDLEDLKKASDGIAGMLLYLDNLKNSKSELLSTNMS